MHVWARTGVAVMTKAAAIAKTPAVRRAGVDMSAPLKRAVTIKESNVNVRRYLALAEKP
jgi:hypothetical protein